MNGSDTLIQAYPELVEELRGLPEDVRLVEADSGSAPHHGVESFLTLYLEAGEKVLELTYTRFADGRVTKGVGELP